MPEEIYTNADMAPHNPVNCGVEEGLPDGTSERGGQSGGVGGTFSNVELAQSALVYAVDDKAREEIRDNHSDELGVSSQAHIPPEEQMGVTGEGYPSPWYSRVSREHVLALGKSVTGAVSSVLGLKSIYSVPEYFRERFALRGLRAGDVEIEKSLASTGEMLISQSRGVRERARAQQALPSVQAEKGKSDISDMEEAEALNQHEGEDAALEGQEVLFDEEGNLADSPAPVRDAIAQLHRKLGMTKEGMVRGSEARKELARILREGRNSEDLDKEHVRAEITEVLDTHMEQKVNGLEATKEALNSLFVGTGAYALRPLMYASMDVAGFLQEAKKAAQREQVNFESSFVAKRFAEHAKEFLLRVRGQDEKSKEGIGNRLVSQGTAIATLAKYAGIASTATMDSARLVEDLEKLTDASLENIPDHFSGNVDRIVAGIRNTTSSVGGFFVQESHATEQVPQVETFPDDVGEKAWKGALESAERHEYRAGKHGAMVRSLTDTVYGLAGSDATPQGQREVWEALRSQMVQEGVEQQHSVVRELDSFFNTREELHTRQQIPSTPPESGATREALPLDTRAEEGLAPRVGTEDSVERSGEEMVRMEQLRDALRDIERTTGLNDSQKSMLREAESILKETRGAHIPVSDQPQTEHMPDTVLHHGKEEVGNPIQSATAGERLATPEVSPVVIEKMWASMERITEQKLVSGLERGKIFQSIKDTIFGEAHVQFGNGAGPEEQRAMWRAYYEKVPDTLKEHPAVKQAHAFFESRVRPTHR